MHRRNEDGRELLARNILMLGVLIDILVRGSWRVASSVPNKKFHSLRVNRARGSCLHSLVYSRRSRSYLRVVSLRCRSIRVVEHQKIVWRLGGLERGVPEGSTGKYVTVAS